MLPCTGTGYAEVTNAGVSVASGKHTKSCGKIHHVQGVNPRTKWAIFNSYVTNYQRVMLVLIPGDSL